MTYQLICLLINSLGVCIFNVVDDLSNAKVVATTRPSNFAAADICQNMIDSSANTNIKNT